MPKIVIKDGENIESALKRFKRVSSETKREVKKHEFHLRPGLKRKEKSKEAQKRQRKAKKQFGY
jgi:small subunit ribosomal protein S21